MKSNENSEHSAEGQGPEQFLPGSTFRNGRERGLEEYEKMLRFKAKDLEGKTVLELGSGEKEVFSQELRAAGVNATVICLNPDFIYNPNYRKQIQDLALNHHELEGKSVGAVAQHLPFKEGSFDEILVNHSLSVFASPRDNLEAAKMWAEEVIRVLKPGGKCRICPVEPEFFKKWNYDYLFEIWYGKHAQISVENVHSVELLGEYSQSMDSSGNIRLERRDPNRVLYHTLIVQKKLQSEN